MKILSSRLALAKLHGAIIAIIVIVASMAGVISYFTALQSSPNQSPTNSPSFSSTPSHTVQPSPNSITNPTSSPTPIPSATPIATPTNTPIDPAQLAKISVISSINYTISSTLTSLINDMPRNPNSTLYFQAKINLLQDPNLYSKIVNGNFFVVDFVSSTNGHQIPIMAVFPADDMRGGAAQAVQWVKSGIPFLESFMALPIPRNQITIWYGFQIGNAGGGGTIWSEDQATYESRFRDGMMPYEALYYHELSHSYIGHESLNQFLELYQYNLVHSGSTSFQDWTNYRVPKENWPWINAILDIYQLIGHDTMANVYRILYTMNPPYGQLLSQQCQEVFVDQAPADLKAQVAILAAKITY